MKPISKDRCNEEVYLRGEHIFTAWEDRNFQFNPYIEIQEPTLDPLSKEVINYWLAKAGEESGQHLDWHWIGGRVVIKWLGNDKNKAREAVERLKPAQAGLKWVGDLVGGI